MAEVASPEGFAANPQQVWRFYGERRRNMTGVTPNAAHHALVAAEKRLGDRFLLVTQNVDALHTAAGSERMIELHGNLMRTRCSVCDRPSFADTSTYNDKLPTCETCDGRGRKSLLRPDIVWFGEAINPQLMNRISRFLATASTRRTPSGYADLVFLAIGTSGNVYPAAGLVNAVRGIGGHTYLANLEESDNGYQFQETILGKASEVVPALFA